MEVNKINHIGPKLLETRLKGLDDLVMLVVARLVGILDLGGQGEAPLLPLCLAGEGLLLPANINTRRVDLVVAP